MENSTDRPKLLHLIKDVRSGKIPAAQLTLEDRRACVEYFWAEGLSAHETAVVMRVSDRTIGRDRCAIRHANAMRRDKNHGDELIGELRRRAEIATERLARAVRDTPEGPTVTPHMRIRAAIHSYRIFDRLIYRLWKLGYLDAPSPFASWSDDMAEEFIRGLRG